MFGDLLKHLVVNCGIFQTSPYTERSQSHQQSSRAPLPHGTPPTQGQKKSHPKFFSMERRSKPQNAPNYRKIGKYKHNGTQVTPTSNEVQNFIITQVRLHHRTARNAAFTTWKKAAQNLNFFPDRHVQWNAGYKAPCAKDSSITPAVAPAGAAPSSSSSISHTSGSTKHQTSSSTKHSDVQVPSKTVLGTRPEGGSERGANEVRRRPSKFHELYCLSRWRNTWKLTHKHLPCMWNRMVGMITLPNLITSHHLTSPAIRTEDECITASASQKCFQQTLLRTCSISWFQHGSPTNRDFVKVLGLNYCNQLKHFAWIRAEYLQVSLHSSRGISGQLLFKHIAYHNFNMDLQLNASWCDFWGDNSATNSNILLNRVRLQPLSVLVV